MDLKTGTCGSRLKRFLQQNFKHLSLCGKVTPQHIIYFRSISNMDVQSLLKSVLVFVDLVFQLNLWCTYSSWSWLIPWISITYKYYFHNIVRIMKNISRLGFFPLLQYKILTSFIKESGFWNCTYDSCQNFVIMKISIVIFFSIMN